MQGNLKLTNEDVEKEQIDLLQAYHKVFGGAEGKKVLVDLSNNFRMSSPTITSDEFAIGRPDMLMAYREGLRGSILYILSQLQVKPEDFLQEFSNV